jgi:hypothetical protein
MTGSYRTIRFSLVASRGVESTRLGPWYRGLVRRALAFFVVSALSACAVFSNGESVRHWDPETGEVDCPMKLPIAATATTVVLGVFAGGAFYKIEHPDVQTYDQYGRPNNVVWGPNFYRTVAYTSAGAGVIAALVSAIEWSGYARCHRIDSRVRALVGAHDCATVVQLDAELAKLDPELRIAVRANEPVVAACVGANAAGAGQGPR